MQTASTVLMNTADQKQEFLSSEKTTRVQISSHFEIGEEAQKLYFREVTAQPSRLSG